MNTDFRILLISDDPYHLGLLRGYCHAHQYKILETTNDIESLKSLIQMQPNIIIIAAGHLKNTDFDLVRELSTLHQIPVCYLLNTTYATRIEKNVASWVDAMLDAPLDIDQLNDYLQNRFNYHPRFIQEKRNRARRAANDRRQAMLDQQHVANEDTHQANNHSQRNGDADFFIVEPFKIDQRSKRVMLKGNSLNLTRKEFELFKLLAQDVDRVFMCDEIITHVWPENNRVTKSDLYQYMHLLRKKVELDPNNPCWILTVKGFGYKLNVAGSAKPNLPDAHEKENTK